jgi:hypothetical protein
VGWHFRDMTRAFAPLAGADSEAPFKAGIEKTQVSETTALSHMDNLHRGIPQQRDGFQQAHFHLQCNNGSPEELVKKPIKMASAAAKLHCEFVYGKGEQFRGREFLEHTPHMLVKPDEAGAWGGSIFEFLSEYGRRNPQQLASMVQVETLLYPRYEGLAFRGHGARCGINLRSIEPLGYILQA